MSYRLIPFISVDRIVSVPMNRRAVEASFQVTSPELRGVLNTASDVENLIRVLEDAIDYVKHWASENITDEPENGFNVLRIRKGPRNETEKN